MGTRLLGIVLWGRVYWAWSNGDASTWHNPMGMSLLGIILWGCVYWAIVLWGCVYWAFDCYRWVSSHWFSLRILGLGQRSKLHVYVQRCLVCLVGYFRSSRIRALWRNWFQKSDLLEDYILKIPDVETNILMAFRYPWMMASDCVPAVWKIFFWVHLD